MKIFAPLAAATLFFALLSPIHAEDQCPLMESRAGLVGYEIGGPYKLDHFRLTKGRTDLREFLWKHWHEHIKGVAEARVGTIDAGIVTAFYLIQPDTEGNWGIQVEIRRPVQPPPCSTFHADSIARLPIPKPDEDYPSQTLGFWLRDGTLPKTRIADSDVKDSKYYWVVLVEKGKATSGTI